MKQTQQVLAGINILKVSVPLILLLIGVSVTGVLYPEIYTGSAPNWLAQSIGQDAVDLFLIVPVLILGTAYSFASNRMAVYLWVGTLLYLVYTFMIYSFTVRFNALFIPYCLILGLSLFSIIWFFSDESREYRGTVGGKALKVAGIYFIVTSISFYVLWLADILPASLNNEVPETIRVAGLITNPVHVLDLSFFLPATFIIGISALRRTRLSLVLTPVMLTFFILMDLTIAALSMIMKVRGVGGNEVASIVMGLLAVFTAALLVRFARESSIPRGALPSR